MVEFIKLFKRPFFLSIPGIETVTFFLCDVNNARIFCIYEKSNRVLSILSIYSNTSNRVINVWLTDLSSCQTISNQAIARSSPWAHQFIQLGKRSLTEKKFRRVIRTRNLREYRCDALATELWSHTLGARCLYTVSISFMRNIEPTKIAWPPMCGFIAQFEEHRTGIRGGHGFEIRWWSPEFFFSQLHKLVGSRRGSYNCLLLSAMQNNFIYSFIYFLHGKYRK